MSTFIFLKTKFPETAYCNWSKWCICWVLFLALDLDTSPSQIYGIFRMGAHFHCNKRTANPMVWLTVVTTMEPSSTENTQTILVNWLNPLLVWDLLTIIDFSFMRVFQWPKKEQHVGQTLISGDKITWSVLPTINPDLHFCILRVSHFKVWGEKMSSFPWIQAAFLS